MRGFSTNLMRRWPSAALVALGLSIAFLQRPVAAWTDTRIELIADPRLFLAQVSQLWTGTVDLGHIQSSQFVGYLFPMGSFFAVGDTIGLPTWVTQRLWVGLLLAVAGCGAAALLRTLKPDCRNLQVLVAGIFYIASPFVVIGFGRGTVWLLPYAFLPWLLVAVHFGMRQPRSWLAPAAIGVLVAASAGGVNAAVVAWLIVGVILFAVFEAITSRGWRALIAWGWRTLLLSAVLSAWWVVPVLMQVLYGTDYLSFTEHARSILNTPSASESFRLLGYWVAYINGYPENQPQLPMMSTYLLSAPVVIGTFLVPAVAVATAALSSKWRYAGFFAFLLAFAVIVMSFGFPPESRVGQVVVDLYYEAGPLQFLRTTYKAAPLAGLSIAVLAGVGLGELFSKARSSGVAIAGIQVNRAATTVAASVLILGLVIAWGRPLWTGSAIDSRLAFDQIPPAWTDAVAAAERAAPPGTRIAVLPGEAFSWYRWAGTQTSVAPALSSRPVIIRQLHRPSPPQAAQLLESVDNALQHGRLTPNQLPPLLRLMGVGSVIVGTDSSPTRNENLDPATVDRELSRQPGFRTPEAVFGPAQQFSPPPDRSGRTVVLPQTRVYAAPRPAVPKIERINPAVGPQVVDGDAEGIVSMAAVGALNPNQASFYAADLDRTTFEELLSDRPTLTFTDSNRRRLLLPSAMSASTSQTLPADQPIDRIFPQYEPFPGSGTEAQTVAVYSGIDSLTSPATPGFSFSPDERPFSAFDGRNETTWIPQSENAPERYVEVRLSRSLESPYLLLRPHWDRIAQTRNVFISVDGGPYREFALRPGLNRLRVESTPERSIRFLVSSRRNVLGLPGPAGIDEIRIPGTRVREALRLPTTLASLARGTDLTGVPFRVVVERAVVDFPRRTGIRSGPAFLLRRTQATNPEESMRRVLTMPAEREYRASGWASVRPTASDAALDRLAGVTGPSRYTSSSRYEGLGIYRSSSAFDGDRATAWAAEFDGDQPPWLQWEGSETVSLDSVEIDQRRGQFLPITRVWVGTENGGFEAPVSADGKVQLPGTITGKRLRVEIKRVRSPAITKERRYFPVAVAIDEVRAAGVPRVSPARSGPLNSQCGALVLRNGRDSADARVTGQIGEMDYGGSLRIKGCSEPLAIPEGTSTLVAVAGPAFVADHLRLDSRPTRASPALATARPRILSNGSVSGSDPAWLVLGQSYSSGWRASCQGAGGEKRSLGAPVQIDGFANGWRIDAATCGKASFYFAPQRAANAAFVISGIAVLACVLVAVVALRRRRHRHDELGASVNKLNGPGGQEPARDEKPRGFRASASLWLLLGASGAIALLGPLYVTNLDPTGQGINFNFSLNQITAHWVALLAALALGLGALLRMALTVPNAPAKGGDERP